MQRHLLKSNKNAELAQFLVSFSAFVFGADEGTCREQSERNSEMSVLAQANERHPQGCEFSTSVPVAEPHKGSKTQKKQATKGLLFIGADDET